MKGVLILISLFAFSAMADVATDAPLSSFKPGQLAAMIQNKEALQAISAQKAWLVDGKVYPQEFDADEAVANGKIVCSFFIPSGELKHDSYKLYYSEHYEFNADHLQFQSQNNFFGITCFKQEGKSVLTLMDINQAFDTLLVYLSVP